MHFTQSIVGAVALYTFLFAPLLPINNDGSTTISSRHVPSISTGQTAYVTDVVDGDTIKVEFPNGEEDTVRLIGVDTPEVHVKNQPEEFEGVTSEEHLRRWGKKASRFARRKLSEKWVLLQRDPNLDNRGSFGRLLRYVYVDGGSFNYTLIHNGYARVYESSFSERRVFNRIEKRARIQDVGLWVVGTE